MRALWVVVPFVLPCCGGETDAVGTGGGGTGGLDASMLDAPDASSYDVQVETSVGGAAGETADQKYAWVCKDGGHPNTGKLRFSCCNGHVCLGTCEQGQCQCGDIAGGCALPSLCCLLAKDSDLLVCGGSGVCDSLG